MASDDEVPFTVTEKGVSAPSGARTGTFATLKIRNYRLFWSGNLANFFAMMMQSPAQAWLAYELTRSPLMLGLVSAAWALPICLFSFIGGVFIDRFQKRNLLILGQACSAVLMLAIGILIATGHIQYWHLLMTAFINGTLSSFSFPTSQALIPELVPRDKLFNAIALNSAGFNITRVAGPALSGTLIGLGGASTAYFTAVGFFALSVVLTSMLPPTSRIVKGVRRSIKKELQEGFGYLRAHSIILTLIAMEIVLNILGMPFQNLMPVFADIFRVKAFGYGMLMAITGVGALIGSLGIATFNHRIRARGRFLLTSGIIYGVTLIVFATSPYWGSALGLGGGTVFAASVILMLVGIFSTFYLSTSNTTIQMMVKDEVRGRVMGVYGIVMGLMPLGVLPAGAVAEAIGAPLTITMLGALLTGFMLAMGVFAVSVRKLA